MDTSVDPEQVEQKQIDDLRQQNIGRLFLRAHRAFSTRSVELLREVGHEGLSLAHTTLLANLDRNGTRINVLAERAGITKQSMGQLVIDLAQRGYVECTPDPTDGRATIVTFTAQGKQFLVDAYYLKLKLEAEYTAVLGKEDYQQLRTLLTKLLDAIQPGTEPEETE
ncbi:MAG: MarR family winged helix-turn-helix transcriptional regulator [Chloroflexota bacterium]